jgi:hypothetical protein
MKIQLLLGIGAAVIVVGTGVLLLTPAPTQESTTVAPEQDVAIDTQERLTGSGVLADLFGTTGSLICNYSSVDESGIRNEGTMYYDEGRERFQVRNELIDGSDTFKSGVINDGAMIYTWSESAEGVFAFAIPVEDTDMEGVEEEVVLPEGVPSPQYDDGQDALNTTVEYDCVSWTVDESIFEPPANLEFISPEDMFREAFGGLEMGDFAIPPELQ